MKYKKLGKTGLYVSEICLGTMTYGGKGFWEVIGKLGLDSVQSQFRLAYDSGVNFIDTANVYHEGESEKLTGDAIGKLGLPRNELVIATKVKGRMGKGANDVGLTRKHIFDSIDASLQRLQMDHVDLYQIHGFDPVTPVEETLDALNDIVRSGRARYIGFCNLPAWLAMKALSVSDAKGYARFVSAQVHYTIAGRDIEREIVPLAKEEGLGILPWSPLAGGLLTGKFSRNGEGPSDARRAQFDFPPVNKDRLFNTIDVIRPIAEAHNVSISQIAIAYLLQKPFVTSVIIGAKTNEQLKDNLASVNVKFTSDEIKALDDVSNLPSEYPGWMLGFQQRDRYIEGAERKDIL
ncbi:MAG: aldo/keto reductase [Leptospiraceae bacterium]|nr:aldo/keto reductase [Leptospiraceae bacterium]MCP5493121.1 aldo/keto reductase [Leptospiraceae bacterium]